MAAAAFAPFELIYGSDPTGMLASSSLFLSGGPSDGAPSHDSAGSIWCPIISSLAKKCVMQ
jgi:hypothetical protein